MLSIDILATATESLLPLAYNLTAASVVSATSLAARKGGLRTEGEGGASTPEAARNGPTKQGHLARQLECARECLHSDDRSRLPPARDLAFPLAAGPLHQY